MAEYRMDKFDYNNNTYILEDSRDIGGRNLLTDIKENEEITATFASNSTASFINSYAANINQKLGIKDYTLSFEAKGNSSFNINCYWYSPNTTIKAETSQGTSNTSVDGGTIFTVTTSWKRYWIHWTQSADNTEEIKHLIVGRIPTKPTSGSSILTLRNIKFETGAKATAWTPAPEKVDSDLMSKLVAKAGDTMTGLLSLQANQYDDTYTSGALKLNNSNILGVNSIYTADIAGDSKKGIHFCVDTSHVDTVYAKSGILYFVPNRALGTVGTSYKIVYDGEGSSLHEAYLTWGGKSFSGDYAPIDAALVPELGANRLAFLDPSRIQIEYSRNGGTKWDDYGATNAQKLGLFSEVGTSLQIGKADSSNKATNQFLLRVTLNFYPSDTIPNVYTTLNKFVIYVSTNSNSGCYVLIDHALKSSETSYTLVEPYSCDATTKRTPLSGWSGYNVINFPSFTTYGNSSAQSWQYSKVRFTFGCTGGTGTTSNGFTILKILGFGGVGWGTPSTLAKYNRIYTYDVFQNTTFPGKITATQFLGDGTLLKWQESSLSPQNIYNVGIYAGKNSNDIIGPSGSHSYIMLNLPWTTASNRTTPGWGLSIAGSSSNDSRLFFRTSNASTWSGWQELAHTPAGTAVGSDTQPVYVTNTGVLTAGLDYKDFTIDIRQGKGTLITQNSNLDTDYNEPGTYISVSSSITGSLTGIGSPSTGSGFKLFTIGGYNNFTDSTTNQITQILISNTKTDFFLRGRNNDGAGWSNWHKLVTISADDSDGKTFTITNNAIPRLNGTVGNLGKIQNSTATIDDNGNLSLFGTLYLNRWTSPNYGRISYYLPTFKSWFTYMSNSVAGTAPTGGQPSTLGNVTSYALRHLIEPNSGYGWIWETAANEAAASTSTKTTPRMSLSANTGQLWIAPNAASDTVGSSGLIIDTSINGGKGNAAIELYRGNPNGSTAASCSWQIANIGGNLHFKDNWTSGALTTYQNDQLILNYNTGNVEIVKGSLYFNATSVGRAIYFKDKKSTIFPAIRYNGANLWIGGEGNLAHQVGQTFISAGYQSDEVTSNRSIVVALPQKEGTTVSYSSYYIPYITQANTVKANYLMYFTKTDGAGITPFTTIKRTFTSQNGSTPAHDNILFDQEGEATFKTTRKSGTSGGWAVAPIRFINGKDSTGQNENNDTYFYMGAYGTGFTFRYAFLGPQSYEGTKNLRIYPDGKVTSLSFETPSANIGTLNVEDSFYADDINAGNLIVNGSGTFVQKVTASQYTGSGVINHTTSPLGWESNTGNGLKIPTLNTIAYWNGCYNNDSSNLKYGRVGSQTIQFGNAIGRTVLETQLTSNTTDNNKLPTALAIKNSLGYVTPQMFGAYGDGKHDDTNAIQAALDASLNVYIPAGIYLVSYPLIVRTGTHLTGASSSATTLKVISKYFLNEIANDDDYPAEIKNATPFNCNKYPHPSSWSNSSYTASYFANGYITSEGKEKIITTTNENDIKICRYKFLQEEEIGNYVIEVIESIRANYCNQYNSSNNDSLYRPAFAGNQSSFLIENFSINCNHSKNATSEVAVGGLRIMRPYNKCAIRNVYVDHCTCRALYVGDEVSIDYINKHYSYWKNLERLDPTDEGSAIKMLRRRTRSQTLVIDNCQFMGSDQGKHFDPTKYYNSNFAETTNENLSGYYKYDLVYWRPHWLSDWRWDKITNMSVWSNATGEDNKPLPADLDHYGKYTNQNYSFTYTHGNESGTIQQNTTDTVHKRQLGGNVWFSYQTDALVYIHNSFELNLKDTKIMFKSRNFKVHPCAIFNNCTDLYVRGCSFAGTLGEAVRIVGPTKYFRLIGNTYEIIGIMPVENGTDTTDLTGGGFSTMGIHNIYRRTDGYTGVPANTINPGSSNIEPLFKGEAPYVINCKGLYAAASGNNAEINANLPYENPAPGTRQIVSGGIIIETTYNNTPRRVLLTNTSDITIMGSFTREAIQSIYDEGTFLLNSVEGHIKIDNFSTKNLHKKYRIVANQTESNGSWTRYGELSLTDVPTGFTPIGALITAGGGTRPAIATVTGSSSADFTLYLHTVASGNVAFDVEVIFAK